MSDQHQFQPGQYDPRATHGYYQPQQPTQPRRKRHPIRNTILAVAGVFTLIGIIAGVSGGGTDRGTAAPTDTPAAVETHVAPAPPAEVTVPNPVTEETSVADPPPAAPRVLLDLSGSGIKNTKPVQVDGPWTLKYSFDCTGFAGGQGNFIVVAAGDDGLPVAIPINALDASGQDSSEVYQTGHLHLEINSECTWHVIVVG